MFKNKLFFIRSNAFTLVELLIVVGIVAIIATLAYANFSGFKNKRNFELDVEKIVEGIRNAQNNSIVQERGAGWGIVFTSASSSSFFEIKQNSSSSASSGKTVMSGGSFVSPLIGQTLSIQFTPRTGKPLDNMAHTVVFKSRTSVDVYVITVSAQGMITKRAQTGLALYLSFDEATSTTAYDYSGTGNNATLQGVDRSTECRAGRCVNINSQNGYISFGTTEFGSVRGTVSLWAKSAGSATDSYIFYHYNGGERLYIRPNNPTRFIVGVDGGTYYANASPFDTVWTHYVLTYDNQVPISYFYKNGLPVASSTYTTDGTISFGATARIGYGSAQSFLGLIDDVWVYNRALDPQEVISLYESY